MSDPLPQHDDFGVVLCFSLDPEGDPLCVLLMIDYYALRADESSYLLMLFREWEV